MAVNHHCETHEKMVHKTELQWILGCIILVLTGSISYILYCGASKEQVIAVEKAISFKVSSVERQMDRDRDEFRENQREIAKELRELNVYIRNGGGK